ncbi:MAG TPA: FecR family protein [Bryobacteraceae bacterium]|nr:FecR family protein [Bryobacteraceae bacterium]
MTPDNRFTDAALEQAMTEMRNDAVDDAVMEAAAARVWAKLADVAAQAGAAAPVSEHIRGCADFQAFFPAYRAGRLPKAKALLIEDHLHQCVACRRTYEGKVVAMPAAPAVTAAPARSRHIVMWAAAAAAVVIASTGVYIYMSPVGGVHQRAMVQALNGRVYLVTDAGFQPLAVNQDLPNGVEIRTAQDSDAVLRLHDGSQVELRERSGFSTSGSGNDLTVRLLRGSVIVEAAKRRTGHLYVDTVDCRVAVTGTIFGVSVGAKGSRVSVVQGQVQVTQGSAERVLKPGEQAVTSEDIVPEPVRNDISWSRNHDRYYALLGLQKAIEGVHMPDLRYSSKLLGRLPANAVLFASIPNLADYLGKVESIFSQKMAESPELGQWWSEYGRHVTAVLEKVREAGGYLGDEIAVVGVENSGGPVLFAEVKRDGFQQFLTGLNMQIAVESRNGFVVFGPDRNSVESLAGIMDNASGGFAGTPFYARIAQAYAEGAGLLLCADVSRIRPGTATNGMKYFVAEQTEVNHQAQARASLSFTGARMGPMAWLADPAPMGSLEYVSPEASGVGAFVVRDPAAILDQITGIAKTTPANVGAAEPDVQTNLRASLGGEFAFAVDGPLLPVPSWKLIVETYDPAKTEAAIEQLVAGYNQHPSQMVQSLVVTHETADGGSAFYAITGTPKNPLIEAHYTFRDGYMIAAPTKVLVTRALQMKSAGTSILRSSTFMSLTPRDHYANYSAVIYHDMGSQLAPIAGLLSGLAPKGAPRMPQLTNLKPMLLAAYSEPDSLTVASNSDLLGMSLGRLLTGDWSTGMLPFGDMAGTRDRKKAYR